MIYLLHFDQPLSHAKHYLGYSSKPKQRIEEHRNGTGKCARIMQVLKERGITFTVAWIKKGDRNYERSLKSRGKARICPLCKGAKSEEKI